MSSVPLAPLTPLSSFPASSCAAPACSRPPPLTPSLHRMPLTCRHAGIVRELQAVTTVAAMWPPKLAIINSSAHREGKGVSSRGWRPRSDGLYSIPGTADSSRTLRTGKQWAVVSGTQVSPTCNPDPCYHEALRCPSYVRCSFLRLWC